MLTALGLVLLGTAFTSMGIGALVAPCAIVRLFGTPSLSRDGRNEVRAVYGGYGVAMGVVVAAAAIRPELRDGVLLTVGVALLGMAAGRLIACVTDRGWGPIPRLFCVLEAALGGLALAIR